MINKSQSSFCCQVIHALRLERYSNDEIDDKIYNTYFLISFVYLNSNGDALFQVDRKCLRMRTGSI
jgi:hypothetical protein